MPINVSHEPSPLVFGRLARKIGEGQKQEQRRQERLQQENALQQYQRQMRMLRERLQARAAESARARDHDVRVQDLRQEDYLERQRQQAALREEQRQEELEDTKELYEYRLTVDQRQREQQLNEAEAAVMQMEDLTPEQRQQALETIRLKKAGLKPQAVRKGPTMAEQMSKNMGVIQTPDGPHQVLFGPNGNVEKDFTAEQQQRELERQNNKATYVQNQYKALMEMTDPSNPGQLRYTPEQAWDLAKQQADELFGEQDADEESAGGQAAPGQSGGQAARAAQTAINQANRGGPGAPIPVPGMSGQPVAPGGQLTKDAAGRTRYPIDYEPDPELQAQVEAAPLGEDVPAPDKLPQQTLDAIVTAAEGGDPEALWYLDRHGQLDKYGLNQVPEKPKTQEEIVAELQSQVDDKQKDIGQRHVEDFDVMLDAYVDLYAQDSSIWDRMAARQAFPGNPKDDMQETIERWYKEAPDQFTHFMAKNPGTADFIVEHFLERGQEKGSQISKEILRKGLPTHPLYRSDRMVVPDDLAESKKLQQHYTPPDRRTLKLFSKATNVDPGASKESRDALRKIYEGIVIGDKTIYDLESEFEKLTPAQFEATSLFLYANELVREDSLE